MRILFIVIVLGALGFLGWVFREELSGRIDSVTTTEAATDPAAGQPDGTSAAPGTPGLPGSPNVAPLPRQFAPAGSFYVKERVSIETPTGIKALNAGELVTLRFRNNDGTARVSTGKEELTVAEAMLTNDPDEVRR